MACSASHETRRFVLAAYDKRYQVFVSSTYLDLKEERHAVIMALLQLNAIPSGMELFPAADEDAWTLIKGVIDDCDYYLLVVGGKYGSVDPVEDIGYTEKEYDYAAASGKPVMAFLHGDPDLIPVGKSEKSEEAQEKLAAFRTKIQGRKHVKYWTSPDDLAGKVALTFGQFIKNYPALGWIRADQQANPETLAEINDLHKRVAEMQLALDEARTAPPAGTEALSQGDENFEVGMPYSLACEAPTRPRETVSDSIKIKTSWDEVFSALGPLMLDESAEHALQDALNTWVGLENFADVKKHVLEMIKYKGSDPSKVQIYRYKTYLFDHDFHTILIQLMALGLIAKSERRRSVADKGTFWTLTPYGQTRLIQLRAIRKKTAGDANPLPEPAKGHDQ
jgi:Domain of unknown function (DUF4062)